MRFADVIRVKDEPAVYSKAQAQISIPVNGTSIQIQSRPGCPLIVDPEQKAAVEYFGVLRTRVLRARTKSDLRVVLITSPQGQDGKTFTSLNLAISLAQLQRERVLLVDGDLRLRDATRNLDAQRSAGLADFLRTSHPFENCVRATSLPHLHVTPAGNVPADSLPGLLEGSGWPEFLQKARERFDFIVVDSVPVSAPIADLELLLSSCDAALLVVQVRRTSREALDFSARQIQDKLLGVIVNNIEPRSNSYYHESRNVKKRG